MAANNFRHALFCAIITLIISYPIIGFNLEAQGISVTLTGADTSTVILVLLAAVIVFLFQLFRDQIMGGLKSIPSPLPKTQKEPMAENKRAKIESWVLTGIVVLALFWPFFVSRGAVDLATLVLIYVMLALGLNVVVGLAGLLDLGYVAFYAVGAYTFALLSQYAGISFWMALPIGACLAALFGLVLGFPVLRLRGDYLAIVTLGFGEIIRILLNNWTAVTGGPNGIGGIPDPTLFGMEFGRRVREEGNTSGKVLPSGRKIRLDTSRLVSRCRVRFKKVKSGRGPPSIYNIRSLVFNTLIENVRRLFSEVTSPS